MTRAVSVSDYRELARRRLPRFLFEYIDGGAFDELTLQRNRTDLQAVELEQRVLRDISGLDLTTDFLGERLAMPLALGPIGLAGMNARRGEIQAAWAAADAGVPFCLSTVSVCSIAEIRRARAPFWLQLYMIRDRAFMRDLLAEAGSAGVSHLVFTVDMPVPGTRYRDYRSGLAGAPGLGGATRRTLQALQRPHWAWDVGVFGRPHALGNVAPVLGPRSGLEDFFAWMRANFDPTVTWRDLEWVRDAWPGRLVLKGVLNPQDAVTAVEIGVDAVTVSNHGGRQLDGVRSTARALPAVVAAVAGRVPVLADGGVRSGLDVVRLLSLGADLVLLGRAWAYALAGDGRRGVAHMLEIIRSEIAVAMALSGASRLEELQRREAVEQA